MEPTDDGEERRGEEKLIARRTHARSREVLPLLRTWHDALSLLRRVVRARGAASGDAEDLAQEAALRVVAIRVRTAGTFDHGDFPTIPHLVAVARRVIWEARRSARTGQSNEQWVDESDQGVDTRRPSRTPDLDDPVALLLERWPGLALSGEDESLVRLLAAGYRVGEAAIELSWPESAVWSRLRRIRRKLNDLGCGMSF